MTQKILVIFSILCSAVSVAQGNWLRDLGSTTFEEMRDATFDSNGDYVMAGYFTTDLNTGVGNLVSTGNTDIIVMKTDDGGNPIWAVKAGGNGVDRANGIVADNQGNTYITGYFEGSATFGTFNVTGQGWEAYAAKIDVNGNFLWVTTFGGSFGDISHDIALDNSGNVICTGEYKGTATFGPDVLVSQPDNNGIPSYDVFTTKLDNNGNFIWTEDGNAPFDDRGTSVATDNSGNIYISGQFSDTIVFDVQHNSTLLNAGFIVKYNSAGDEQWFDQAWGAQLLFTDMECHNDQIFITGDFISNLFIEDVNNIQNFTGQEDYNVFVGRFDTSGDLEWLTNNYSENEVHSTDIAVDGTGAPYITGDFNCTFTEMNDTYGASTFLSVGYEDIHYIKYNNAGVFQWARQLASDDSDFALSIAIKNPDLPVITGTYESEFFVPATSSFDLDTSQTFISGSANCNDADYQSYISELNQGQKDVFYTSPFDINRQPMDYYQKDPGLSCDLLTYDHCIGNINGIYTCEDTLEGCAPLGLWLNDFLIGAPSPQYDVNWSNGGNGQATAVGASGNYTATATSVDGCYTWTDDVYALINPNPDPPLLSDSWNYNFEEQFPTDIDTCDADSLLLWGTPVSSPNDTIVWVQQPQNSDSSFVVTNSGTYTVYAVNEYGCQSLGTSIDIIINNFALHDTLDPLIMFTHPDIIATDSVISCSLPFCSQVYLLDSAFINQWGTMPNLYSVWYLDGVFVDTLWHNSDDSTEIQSPTNLDYCVSDTGWHYWDTELVNECGDTVNYFVIDSFYVDSIPYPFLEVVGPTAACGDDTITVVATYYTDTIFWAGSNIIANFGDSIHVVFNETNGLSVTAFIDTTEGNTTCPISATHGIPGIPVPQITVGPADGVICPGDSVMFTATSGIAWQWIGPTGDSLGTNQIQYGTDVGEYFCYVTTANGCVVQSEFVSAFAYSAPILYVDEPIICEGDSTFIQVLAPTNTVINWLPTLSGSANFQWVDSAGWYYCETSFCNITKIDSVEIQFSEPLIDPNLFNDTTICPYDTLVLVGPMGMIEYLWNDVPGLNTYEVVDSGQYWLHVEDQFGCVADSDTMTVSYHALPAPPIATDTTVCPHTDATLFATGSGTIDWFSNTGNYLFTGSPYVATAIGGSTYYLVTNSDAFCASFPDTATVNVFPDTVNADFVIIDTCGSLNIQVQNTGTPGIDYQWDMGDNTILNGSVVNHTYAANGTYTIQLISTDPSCGFIDSTTMDVTVYGQSVQTIFNHPTCYQFSDGSLTLNLVDGVGGETFLIQDSLGNQLNVGGTNTANNLPAGWYYWEVYLGPGCTLMDSSEIIDPGELMATINLYPPPCYGMTGSATVDTVLNWQGDYNNISFFWNPNTAGIGGVWADSSWNMTAGDYVLTVNDDNGCSNAIDLTMTQPDPLAFTELGSDPAYCRLFDYQNGNGVVYAAANGGTPAYTYLWINLDTGDSTINTTWGGLNPGLFQITVTDNNGCTLIDTVRVDSVNPIVEFEMTSLDFTIQYEGDAPVEVHFENFSQYFANPNNPNADTTFFWHFDHPNDPPGWVISHDINETFDTTYSHAGAYTICLVAMNKNGCTDTLCKELIVYDPVHLDPVNVFTPDGDGVNDEFTFIHKQEGIETFECVVVNRWGVTIREFYDVHDSWDGKDKSGDDCPAGVYFYVYTGTGFNGTQVQGQGSVTIIR